MKNLVINTPIPYNVKVGNGFLKKSGELIKLVSHEGAKVAILTDNNVGDIYGETIKQSLNNAGFQVYYYVFPAGESSKSFEQVMEITSWLVENQFTRSDLIVALGGGVVGDLAGFVASIYLRGIDFVQIPTTFLATIDSSVGGKTGINIPEGKNLVGAFWQPRLVLIDSDTFETLKQEDYISGVAEAIKYGCIWDKSLFERLSSKDWQKHNLNEVILTCVDIKRIVVEQDEKESGLRGILNFGHTVGHAIEKLSDYTIPHGYGVAIGMVVAARAGETQGITLKGTSEQIASTLKEYGLPTSTSYSAKQIATACMGDKKRKGDHINFITIPEIGSSQLTKISINNLEDFIAGGLN